MDQGGHEIGFRNTGLEDTSWAMDCSLLQSQETMGYYLFKLVQLQLFFWHSYGTAVPEPHHPAGHTSHFQPKLIQGQFIPRWSYISSNLLP